MHQIAKLKFFLQHVSSLRDSSLPNYSFQSLAVVFSVFIPMSKLTVLPVLPFDVIGNIIDIFFNDDTKALLYVKDFSLVSHSFLLLCRKHIFSCISIQIGGESFKQPDAFGLLLKNHSISRYLRKLKISIRQSDAYHIFEPTSRLLPRLQSLTISNGGSIHWNEFSASTGNLLLNLMRLPSLTHLDVKGISSFPISNLIDWTNVKHLSVKAFYIEDNDNEAVSSSVKLQTLHISMTSPISLKFLEAKCSDGCPIIDLTDLEKLSIDLIGEAPLKDIFVKIQRLRDVSLQIDGM